jgi:ornithine carbamoyltransferase
MPPLTTHDPTADQPAHLTDIDDLSPSAIQQLVADAAALKSEQASDNPSSTPLAGQTLGMLFEKPSTRTRVSFETAMTQLGGHAQFLGPDDLQLGSGEPLRDTARALSQYVDCLLVRLFDHADLETITDYASVPVINGLTDEAHPCQTLADLLTLRETVGFDAEVAWVGDGNNVCRSLVLACALLDIDVTVASPAEYSLSDDSLDHAAELGHAPKTTTNPAEAVAGADAVYTDAWISMGEADVRETKLPAFEDGDFTVDEKLLDLAAHDAVFMHCLPAHRGEEVTNTVLESEQSVVWQQAENRLHAQKALLTAVSGDTVDESV